MHDSVTVSSTQLRTRFAARLSALYGTEVPAYTTLVEVSQEVVASGVRDPVVRHVGRDGQQSHRALRLVIAGQPVPSAGWSSHSRATVSAPVAQASTLPPAALTSSSWTSRIDAW